MPVSEQTPVNSYTGNGVTTVFPYTFKLLAQADIEVTVDGVVKTLTTDYSVSGVGVDGGGNVTFVTAPSNGSSVVLRRNMAIERTTDYQENGDLPAATLDNDIDRTVMILQQLQADLTRSIKLPAGETTEQELTANAASRAEKLIGFDSSGNVTLLAALDVDITPVSSFMATVLNDSTAAEARGTLGAWGGAGSDIASASTLDLTTATGNIVRITGANPTSAVTLNNGQFIICYAVSAWPLVNHATNHPLPGGADYTCSAGDLVIYSKNGSGEISVQIVPKALHPAVVTQAAAEAGTDTTPRLWTAQRVAQAIAALGAGATLAAPITMSTGSPTIIEISTSIPAGTKRIDIGIAGGSTNSTSNWLVQIGDSGGYETTGYASGCTNDNGTRVTSTAGFIVTSIENAAYSRSGIVTLLLIDEANNTWVESGQLTDTGSGLDANSCGSKSLSGVLTSLRLTTVGGTATFDAGKLAIQYK